MDLTEALSEAKNLAVSAGKLIMDVYEGDFEVCLKADTSPLTIADQLAHEHIVQGLKSKFAYAGVLSEESHETDETLKERYCFIVDPLDGTKEFINRHDEFTVNIGLSCEGVPIMGVVYAPVRDELYYAAKDLGAYKQDRFGITSIRVSEACCDFKLAVSRSHSGDLETDFLKRHEQCIGSILPLGSSLKGCLVAAGEVDGYYRFGKTMEWDTAAMHAICEEAGATIRQLDGTPLTYNRENHLNAKGFYIINHPLNLLKL